MIPHAQLLTSYNLPSPPPILSTAHFLNPCNSLSAPAKGVSSFIKTSRLKCSAASVVSQPPHLELTGDNWRPFPAEVSRTVVELTSVGTLSTLAQDGSPLGFGVRFALDFNGTPILCLNDVDARFSDDRRCSLHVQLEQCGLRTPQCTILGNLNKPSDGIALKKLCSAWKKQHNEEVEESYIYVIDVERVLQIEDYGEVLDAKMVWVDRLGFDVHFTSAQKDVYEVRIPFPREVADEKGAKSSFNGMSQLAWEMEKNFHAPEFKKVKHLKKVGNAVQMSTSDV